jgi:hypothetical protein
VVDLHKTVKPRKYKFDDPDADDPDHIVKQFYTVIIAAASEQEIGVENLFKKGVSRGRKAYPDFGRLMDRTMMWADECHWGHDPKHGSSH